MDFLNIIIVLSILIVIVFVFSHAWVFVCDCVIGRLKKIFHIGNKKKINWHTIDNENEHIS